MPQLFTNNAISLLQENLSAASLVIHVASGTGDSFPQPLNPDDFFLVTLENSAETVNEIVKIVGRNGDLLQVSADGRGVEGTIARQWTTNDIVDLRLTAGSLQSMVPLHWSAELALSTTQESILDQIPIGVHDVLKWQVVITCLALTASQTFEIFALINRYTNTVVWTKNASLGQDISTTINITLVGADAVFSIQNNETSDINVKFMRILT